MIEIMEELQQYVPCVEGEKSVLAEGETEPDLLKVEHFHTLLFGGDQLTAARCRGAQKIRQNSVCGSGRLEGFVPVVEDWHTRVCLLGVSLSFGLIIICMLNLLINSTGYLEQIVQKGKQCGERNNATVEKSCEPNQRTPRATERC